MKTKNKFIIVLLVIIILLIIILIYSNSNKNKICFDKNCFKVEVVSTQEELSKGLMFRKFLDEDSGMLFIFPEENFHSFWMKNTLIPLDIIWINSDNEIVFIKNNTQPCKEENCEIFTPDEKALYVLEINSGTANEIGLEVGDKVNFKLN